MFFLSSDNTLVEGNSIRCQYGLYASYVGPLALTNNLFQSSTSHYYSDINVTFDSTDYPGTVLYSTGNQYAYGTANGAYIVSLAEGAKVGSTSTTPRQSARDSAQPTSTSIYWNVGDIVYNTDPASMTNNFIGWVCTVAGSPGTWQGFGALI